jgi:hypothetical protein
VTTPGFSEASAALLLVPDTGRCDDPEMRTDHIPQIGMTSLISALVMLLTACGASETATPAAPSAAVTQAAPEAGPRSAPPRSTTRDPAPRDTSGASFGVDEVSWPANTQGALKLLHALPQTLRGEPLQVSSSPAEEEEEYGASATAQYGDDNSISVTDEYTTTDTESGEPELFTAGQLLAARFGLVFACAKRSYRGTIEPLEGGQGPGFDSPARSSKPNWFSCRIDGAEGDDDFTGHAVGWTSEKAAWLVIAEDEEAARAIIAGLDAPSK